MMFSILAQGPAVYAEGLAVSEPAQQEEIAAEALLQAALPATPETGSEAETPDAQQAPAAAETPDGEQPLPAEEPETLAEESSFLRRRKPPSSGGGNPAGVEVGVLAGLPLQRTVTLQVTLAGPETRQDTLTLAPAGEEAPSRSSVRFEELPAGQYTLTVQGSGFCRLHPDPDGGKPAVQRAADHRRPGGQTQGTAHPGVLQIGDVDGSGTVEEADATALVEPSRPEPPVRCVI